MDKTTKNIISGTLVYTLCNVFVSGLAVITSPIFTRLMSVEDYGIYSLFNSWNAIVFCVSSLGLSYAIAPAIRSFDKEDIGRFTIGMIICACLLPIMLAFSSMFGANVLFANILSMPDGTVIMLWVYLILYTIIMFENEKLIIEGNYKKYAVLSITRAMASTFLAVVIILYERENTFYGRIMGVLIASLAICVYIVCSNKNNLPSRVKIKDYMIFALPIALPMIFHGLAMVTLGQIDRIMISNLYSNAETGLYSYGYSIGTMIMFVLNASSSAVQHVFYQKLGYDNDELIKTIKKYTEMMAIICIIFALVSPELIKLLADKKYWDTASLVYPLVAGCFCQYVYSFYCKIEIINKKTKYIAIGSALAACVNAGLNAVLLPHFGYQLAAITTFIGYFFLMMFHMIICKKICKVKEFLYLRNLTEALIVFLVLMIISFFVHIVLIRYILTIVFSMLFVFCYKDEIFVLIGNVRKK